MDAAWGPGHLKMYQARCLHARSSPLILPIQLSIFLQEVWETSVFSAHLQSKIFFKKNKEMNILGTF